MSPCKTPHGRARSRKRDPPTPPGPRHRPPRPAPPGCARLTAGAPGSLLRRPHGPRSPTSGSGVRLVGEEECERAAAFSPRSPARGLPPHLVQVHVGPGALGEHLVHRRLHLFSARPAFPAHFRPAGRLFRCGPCRGRSTRRRTADSMVSPPQLAGLDAGGPPTLCSLWPVGLDPRDWPWSQLRWTGFSPACWGAKEAAQ